MIGGIVNVSYEEVLVRDPHSVDHWIAYLDCNASSPPLTRFLLYERALSPSILPQSYKIWHRYLAERVTYTTTHVAAFSLHPTRHRLCRLLYEQTNAVFERCLTSLHKMPVIWCMYLSFLRHQHRLTLTRITFDRALCSLPITQHHTFIWPRYMEWVNTDADAVVETGMRIYRRYMQVEMKACEDYIDYLQRHELWKPLAQHLIHLLNQPKIILQSHSKHELWKKLIYIFNKHTHDIQHNHNYIDSPSSSSSYSYSSSSSSSSTSPSRCSSGLSSVVDVESVIRSGLVRFASECGVLYCCLADYYIRCGELDHARDIYEEGIQRVQTVKDFTIIYDAYATFEESITNINIQNKQTQLSTHHKQEGQGEGEGEGIQEENVDVDVDVDVEIEMEMQLSRLERLTVRHPFLLNGVLLRQNPHHVGEWLKRVSLCGDDPAAILNTFTQAVKTVESQKASHGKLSNIWISFAKYYLYTYTHKHKPKTTKQHKHKTPSSEREREGEGQKETETEMETTDSESGLSNARLVYQRGSEVEYKSIDENVSVWCSWMEQEIKRGNANYAKQQLKQLLQPNSHSHSRSHPHSHPHPPSPSPSSSPPASHSDWNELLSPSVSRVRSGLRRSVRLWSLYVDLEENLGEVSSVRSIYESMLHSAVLTPQLLLHYTSFLQHHDCYEDSFRVYEKGIAHFPFPHSIHIWIDYIKTFNQRYKGKKLERSRDLFEQAITQLTPHLQASSSSSSSFSSSAPLQGDGAAKKRKKVGSLEEFHSSIKLLFLLYASFEEEYGFYRRAMDIYSRACAAVSIQHKYEMYLIYIARCAQLFGLISCRSIYESSSSSSNEISSGFPEGKLEMGADESSSSFTSSSSRFRL